MPKNAVRDHGDLRIQVTEADIARAQQNSSMRCVVARAIARTLPGASRIDVDTQTVRWSQEGERFVYLTPYSISGYVIAFDAGDKIEPFTFVLRHDRRVPIRQPKATEAGLAIAKARNKAARTRKKVDQLELVTSGKTMPPPAPAAQKAAAAELPPTRSKLEEREQQLEAVKAAYADAVQVENHGETARKPPRRVVKSSERHYGQRVLRINQQREE